MEKVWLKSYAKNVPFEIEFEKVVLPDALSRTAGKYPDNPALLFQGTKITFRRLDDMVSRFATGLRTLGIQPGDRVSILLPNIVQTVVAVYGTLRAGAVAVMANPLYTDHELALQFNDAGSNLLVSLDVLVPRMIRLRERTPIRKIVSCHIRDYLPFPLKQLFPLVKRRLHLKTPAAAEVYEFTDLVMKNPPVSQPHGAKWDDPAFLLYTGGTTGTSKGVELSHGNVSVNVQQVGAWFPGFVPGAEVALGCLPFFHVFGLTACMNIAIFYGWADVLVPKPEPKAILENIQRHKVTYVPAVPTMYNGMIDFPALKKYDLSSVKGCFSGGAPLPMETIRRFEALAGAQICEGYGLTESSPVTHVNPYGAKTKPGTIGLPIPNTNSKLVGVNDYNQEITEPGEPGELCVKGPQVMREYINRPDETAIALRDGWLLTGDIAVVDEEGYFSIVDRKKDMIISGGFNIFPRDVDEVLFAHPKVLEACSIGVPDAHSGERVKAFVVLKKEETATPEEIIEYCREYLARYKVPKYLDFVEELPKSAVGKILRKELRRQELAKGEGA